MNRRQTLFSLFIIFWMLFNSKSFCQEGYTLDWSNPSTYFVNCGSVNPAQWKVANDSCYYSSPNIEAGGTAGQPNVTINYTVRINQSGNCIASDRLYIVITVNELQVSSLRVPGDTTSGVFDISGSASVPAGGHMKIKVTMKTSATNRFWLIKNGDVFAGPPPVTLPVELLNFKGSLSGSSALLEWTTASEKNNAFFTLERSQDGRNFKVAGTMNAAGNSSQNTNYVVYDDMGYSRTLYYQLSQTDINGIVTTFKTIVKVSKQDTFDPVISFYPNPVVSNKITITVPQKKSLVHLIISGESGHMVMNTTAESDSKGTLVFSSSDLIPGTYTAKIIFADGKSSSLKFIKQ